MHLLRNSLIACSAAAVLAAPAASIGPAVAAMAASPGSSGSAYQQPSARFAAKARTALVRYLSHDHPGILPVHPQRLRQPPVGSANMLSYNWSGYAVSNPAAGTFTSVGGRWKVPRVKCTPEDEVTSQWVGLDGFTSGTVEQAGTMGWCFLGVATYFTWYEMYPAGTVVVGQSVRPGDAITTSVTRSGTSYTLSLTDSNHPTSSFTRRATCAASTCLATSAEWVAERPSFSIGISPLANFGRWSLSGATVTAAGKTTTIAGYPNRTLINMADATVTYLLSGISALSGGNSFTATWINSY